ncbi:protein-tyrosine phosphatase family protein [Kribbella sp. DT2]|uniref:protein-tyrosine phosphatase family protein n=1 Tax=Kribbella sp. DT2 TaxID=3393427 RepID=UPI003CF805A0
MDQWDSNTPGVLRLPSGRLVRGRGLRKGLPSGPEPTFGVYLLGKTPPPVTWESQWIRWPDFRLPADPAEARKILTQALARLDHDRVEFACGGGKGRTGTALACLSILDGVPPDEAITFVRTNYDRHAVETPWQKRFVRGF